jgi:hypothetical protein
MNNTKRTLAIVAVLTAATLVGVGTFAATSAFAYQKRGGQEQNSKNGNTVTIEECKNRGFASGWDTKVNQECGNTICTHPGDGATCVSEPGQATPTTGTLLVKKVIVCAGYVLCSDLRPADFTITVTGNNPDPDSFPGSGTGTLVRLGVGNYTVNETPLNGFTASFSDDCSGTIAPSDQKTCTVTNTEEMIT